MSLPVKKLSRAEKIHARRLKRKQGPAAQRRRERRESLQPTQFLVPKPPFLTTPAPDAPED